MNPHTDVLKDELKNLNSKNIEEAINVLEGLMVENDDCTQIKGRYNRYKRDLHSDVINQEEKNNEINKISLAVEDIIDSIEENNLNPIYKDWLISKLHTQKHHQIDVELRNFNERIEKINSKVDKTENELFSTKGKLNRSIFIIGLVWALLGLTAYLTHYFTKKGLEDKYSTLDLRMGSAINLGADYLPDKGIYNINASNDVVKVDTFGQVMLEFWTPSILTKKWLINKNRYSSIERIPKRYVVSDDKHEINLFIDKIKDEFHVEGYSKFEAMGAGDEIPKPGWYWKMTINTDANNEYSKDKFLNIFKEHWERKRGIYLIETRLKQGTNFTAN